MNTYNTIRHCLVRSIVQISMAGLDTAKMIIVNNVLCNNAEGDNTVNASVKGIDEYLIYVEVC